MMTTAAIFVQLTFSQIFSAPDVESSSLEYNEEYDEEYDEYHYEDEVTETMDYD